MTLFSRFGYEYQCKDVDEYAFDESSDNDDDCYLDDHDSGNDADSDASTCEYSEIANDYDGKQCSDHGEGHNQSRHGNYHGCGHKHNYNKYRSCHGYCHKYRFNGDKVLGGHNVLHSFSNARSLELLADAREVILNREPKMCPIFSNLKTLSLGDWCLPTKPW